MPVPDSTLGGLESQKDEAASAWGRRVVLAALVALVLAGAAGLLGVRSETATAERGGYALSVQYARVARAGLDVPFRIIVRHPGGFTPNITLAITAEYFTMFETQGFTPQPSSMVRDGSLVYLTFAAPRGDTFVFDYDAYIQPASQVGRDAVVSVVDAALKPAVSVPIDTTLMP